MFLLWLLDGVWKWNLRGLDSIFDSVLCLKSHLPSLSCEGSGLLSRIWKLKSLVWDVWHTASPGDTSSGRRVSCSRAMPGGEPGAWLPPSSPLGLVALQGPSLSPGAGGCLPRGCLAAFWFTSGCVGWEGQRGPTGALCRRWVCVWREAVLAAARPASSSPFFSTTSQAVLPACWVLPRCNPVTLGKPFSYFSVFLEEASAQVREGALQALSVLHTHPKAAVRQRST